MDVVALNCGTGMDMATAAGVIEQYRSACSLPTMAQPNAGKPEMIDGVVHYRQTPEEMAEGAGALLAAGVRILGGLLREHPGAHPAAPRAGGPVQRGVGEGRMTKPE